MQNKLVSTHLTGNPVTGSGSRASVGRPVLAGKLPSLSVSESRHRDANPRWRAGPPAYGLCLLVGSNYRDESEKKAQCGPVARSRSEPYDRIRVVGFGMRSRNLRGRIPQRDARSGLG
eukprot:2409845-Rhodomonas_salina.5